ncbi:MAG: rhomboid family intramembrane serine protease [Burkholderiaceae bacterium]|nr:rhomboid family intramembrane serine protease [Burkholderiaceae bacterium]
MQLHVPDPAFTGSTQARAHFRLAARLALGFVALLWLIHLMNWAAALDPAPFGVHPRQLAGALGVLSAPLAVVGTAMLFLYPSASLRVLPAIYLGPGIAVWLFGRDSTHLGASGLVYGLVAYVFVAGLLRRDRRAIAASFVVAFMYGSLAWGVLPTREPVSWETHLAAALIGVVLAFALRRLDVPPRKRYAWEDEDAIRVEQSPSTTEGDEPTRIRSGV